MFDILNLSSTMLFWYLPKVPEYRRKPASQTHPHVSQRVFEQLLILGVEFLTVRSQEHELAHGPANGLSGFIIKGIPFLGGDIYIIQVYIYIYIYIYERLPQSFSFASPLWNPIF